VTLTLRMKVWLETVPVLLKHVGVEHVAFVTHSAGTIYTLNTLLYHRRFLHPREPYVAFLGSYKPSRSLVEADNIAPWVPTTHHSAVLTIIAARLPTRILNSATDVMTFVNNKVAPSILLLAGIVSTTSTLLTPASTDPKESSDIALLERYGFDESTAKLIAGISSKCQSLENITGANEEIKLCLRKCEDGDWGEAADYSTCIKKLLANEKRLGTEDVGSKLTVNAFFAESDIMIGKKGQRYFVDCWEHDGVRGNFAFEYEIFKDTNHDSVLVDWRKGGLKKVFEQIGDLMSPGHNE
jgi:hypothetical protein